MHVHIELVTDEVPSESDIDNLFYHNTGFDYWQIGGRWKGIHCEGYSRMDDPNHEDKWPTEWKKHDLDTIPVWVMPPGITAYAVLKGSTVFYSDEEEGWNPARAFRIFYEDGLTVKEILDKHNIREGYITTIDCHY